MILLNHVFSIFIYLQIQQFVIMKTTFYEVEKRGTFLKKGWKPNFNNYLRGAYLMVVLWIFASLYILGNEFSDFLHHKVDGWNDETSRYWECYGWPQRGIRKYPCQDGAWYVLEFTIVITNTFLVVLLVVGMVKREYILMVPWIMFRFAIILVSPSVHPLIHTTA